MSPRDKVLQLKGRHMVPSNIVLWRLDQPVTTNFIDIMKDIFGLAAWNQNPIGTQS